MLPHSCCGSEAAFLEASPYQPVSPANVPSAHAPTQGSSAPIYPQVLGDKWHKMEEAGRSWPLCAGPMVSAQAKERTHFPVMFTADSPDFRFPPKGQVAMARAEKEDQCASPEGQ